MNRQDQERINESFAMGVESFTEDDLKKVRKDGAAAEEKSTRLEAQFESFKLTWELLQDYWGGNLSLIHI